MWPKAVLWVPQASGLMVIQDWNQWETVKECERPSKEPLFFLGGGKIMDSNAQRLLVRWPFQTCTFSYHLFGGRCCIWQISFNCGWNHDLAMICIFVGGSQTPKFVEKIYFKPPYDASPKTCFPLCRGIVALPRILSSNMMQERSDWIRLGWNEV